MEKKTVVAACLAGGAALGAALWWRRNPSAFPYGLRLALELPHPFVTRSRLREVLAPRPGERMLEVGPGTGYHALHVARWLEPGGTLDVFDVQQEMLHHTMRRARELGVTNILARRGDARKLPYPDATFDSAYLNVVLGEVPDQQSALRELRRVLKPGGRLVVGEALPDPHMVPLERLLAGAEAAGFRQERRLGGRLGYYARFAA